MASFVCSLPELDPDQTVWRSKDLWFAESRHHMYFNRPVRVRSEAPMNLETVLRTADQGFLSLAKKCGAAVVPHTWGLIPLSEEEVGLLDYPGPQATYKPVDIPKDYALGARVEVINKEEVPNDTPDEMLERGISSFLGFRITAMKRRPLPREAAQAYQFTYGTSASIHEPVMILHDIEPLLS
jgi:hypothetical protein